MARTVLVAAGGTGGHLFPGIAVADELVRREPGTRVVFAGTPKGLESRLVPRAGYALELLPILPLNGVGLVRMLKGLLALPWGLLRSAGLVLRLRPAAVLGVGGYAGGPVTLLAALLGVRAVVLEPNAKPGFTNRVLKPFVRTAACAYEEAQAAFGAKGVLTGNPVRGGFAALPRREHREPLTLLAFGGSQGSRVLNRALVGALPHLPGKERLRIVHQTGPTMRDEVEAAYRGAGREAEVVAFIDDMEKRFAEADLVLSRSGATTCAELTVAGKAAILVPFALAADDHQRTNARALEKAGAARVLEEKGLSGESLAAVVRALADAPERIAAMDEAARRVGRPDAAARVADLLLGTEGTEEPVLRRIQHVHFVGIGGSGMSGIAEVLLNLGYTVSGSDLRLTPVTDRLVSLGATVFEGHAAAHASGAHVVVTSTAVRPPNPEVAEARRHGVPVIPRAEMLAELMRLKYGVAVAGSHGKTTTTSMVALVLDRGGLDPTVVVGGRLGVLGSGARLGKGEFLVAEADESDRSFLRLTPTLAVVTNIDREHLDTYRDLADIQEAFLGFVNKVPFYGGAVLCLDDPPVQDILPRVERRVLTYGLTHQASVSARDLELSPTGSHYTATLDGRPLGPVMLTVPGAYNVTNSLAAVAVGLDLDLPFEAIRAGLEGFTGVDRRFQVRGERGGVLVIDDYGHHPTEIRVTLEALRRRAGERRTVVLFQPHRFTRTQALWDDFGRAFHQADVLLLTDIYPASEEPIPGVTAEALARAVAERGHRQVAWVGDLKSATERLAAEAREGDVVLTLGAGSVWTAGEELLRRRGE